MSFAVMTAFFIAILTKRENLVLIVIPLIHYGYSIINEKNLNKHKELISLAGYCFLVLVYLIFVQNVFIIESTEAQDIEASTFSFLYFQKLAPAFIGSLLNPLYFGITTLLLICLIARSSYLRSIDVNIFALLACWLFYFLLYTFHYRGYFFVKGERISEFETFRYLNNFYCLTPILVYMFFCDIRNSRMLYSAFLVLLLSSVYPTITLRKNFCDDEWRCRFEAPQKTLEILHKEAPSSAIVISPDILTLQILGNNSLFVCDAVHFDKLDFNRNDYQYYMLCRDGDIDYMQRRHGAIIDLRRWSVHSDFENGFKLYKYHH